MKILTFLTLSLICSICVAVDLSLSPNPALTARQVVIHQLEALQKYPQSGGIAATFKFASPANKAVTGPLSRFSTLFDSAQYQPMLNHRAHDVEIIIATDTEASLSVSIVAVYR